MFALVDCNNFYVSCERIFNPKLEGKAVIVLSNNDGCIIARSNEAKALGVPMGAPFFQWKSFLTAQDAVVLSSNYALYGDLSHRVMETLKECAPFIQVYSIDEAFLQLQDGGFEAQGEAIYKRVRKWTGIPVSVGIAPTKTLAKVAGRAAKKGSGVFVMESQETIDRLLERLPVVDVWGIGRGRAQQLNRMGITTAKELADADDHWIRKHLTVTCLKIALELRGTPCLPLEEKLPVKQSICCSRSFSQPIGEIEALFEAVASYAARAAEKLRSQGSSATLMTVFAERHPFQERVAHHVRLTLLEPTDDTLLLISNAKKGIEKLFQKGILYRKVGVVLDGFVSTDAVQGSLFSEGPPNEKRKRALQAVDAVNAKLKYRAVKSAAEGIEQKWRMSRSYSSSRYTTSWEELLTIRL